MQDTFTSVKPKLGRMRPAVRGLDIAGIVDNNAPRRYLCARTRLRLWLPKAR